jgi:hypothetical protein
MATTEAAARVEDDNGTDAPVAARPRGARMSTVFTLAFAVAGMNIGIHKLHDNSFMWHVRTGQFILDHGIPHHDPYSFSAPGAKWVAQSWLAELLYGVVNNLWHGFGLRMIGAVAGAIIGAALYRISWKLTNDRVRSLGLAALAFCVLLQVWSERPLIFGVLGMLALVAICELPDSWIGRRPIVSVPIVMWLWANTHGTFSLGFLYLALHLAGRMWDGAKLNEGREWTLFRGTAIAALVVFLNPYGIDLILFPIRLIGRSSVLSGVEEWQSPTFRDLGGKLFFAWVVLTILVLARKHVGRRDLLVTIVFIVLGFYAVRNVGLTAIVVLPILSRAVRREEAPADDRVPFNTWLVVLVLLVGFATVMRAAGENAWDLKRYPVKAYNVVEAQFPGRHLLTTDAWGGYVIAEDVPNIKQKVFFDDRYDMYPLAVNNAYDDMAQLRPKWLDQLNKWQIDVVMWPKDGPLPQGLSQRPTEWKRVYNDSLAVVYVRIK